MHIKKCTPVSYIKKSKRNKQTCIKKQVPQGAWAQPVEWLTDCTLAGNNMTTFMLIYLRLSIKKSYHRLDWCANVLQYDYYRRERAIALFPVRVKLPGFHDFVMLITVDKRLVYWKKGPKQAVSSNRNRKWEMHYTSVIPVMNMVSSGCCCVCCNSWKLRTECNP